MISRDDGLREYEFKKHARYPELEYSNHPMPLRYPVICRAGIKALRTQVASSVVLTYLRHEGFDKVDDCLTVTRLRKERLEGPKSGS